MSRMRFATVEKLFEVTKSIWSTLRSDISKKLHVFQCFWWAPAALAFVFDVGFLIYCYAFSFRTSIYHLNAFVWLPASCVMILGFIITIKNEPMTAYYASGCMPICISSPLIFCHLCGIVFMRDVYYTNEAFFLLFISSLSYIWFLYLYYKFFLKDTGLILYLQILSGIAFGMLGRTCALNSSCRDPLVGWQIAGLVLLSTFFKALWALQTRKFFEKENYDFHTIGGGSLGSGLLENTSSRGSY